MTPCETRRRGFSPVALGPPFSQAFQRVARDLPGFPPSPQCPTGHHAQRRMALLRTSRRRDRLSWNRDGMPEGLMNFVRLPLLAGLALLGAASRLQAQPPPEPVDITKLPHLEIVSPTFFWNDEADFVRVGSATCSKGRAIAGGVNIMQGKASLRILESYPEGESWVTRVVTRQKPDSVQSLQVRGFAVCLLPAARKGSAMLPQQTRL